MNISAAAQSNLHMNAPIDLKTTKTAARAAVRRAAKTAKAVAETAKAVVETAKAAADAARAAADAEAAAKTAAETAKAATEADAAAETAKNAAKTPAKTPAKTDAKTPATTTQIRLTKKQLKGLLVFVSSDASRVNLSQLWIQDGKALATDGHRALIAGRDGVVPKIDRESGHGYTRAGLERLARGMAGKDEALFYADGSVYLEADNNNGGRDNELVKIERSSDMADFPPIQQVITAPPADSSPSAFNAQYLGDLAQLHSIAGLSKGEPGIVQARVSGLDAGWFTLDAPTAPIPFVCCVLMPTRV